MDNTLKQLVETARVEADTLDIGQSERIKHARDFMNVTDIQARLSALRE